MSPVVHDFLHPSQQSCFKFKSSSQLPSPSYHLLVLSLPILLILEQIHFVLWKNCYVLHCNILHSIVKQYISVITRTYYTGESCYCQSTLLLDLVGFLTTKLPGRRLCKSCEQLRFPLLVHPWTWPWPCAQPADIRQHLYDDCTECSAVWTLEPATHCDHARPSTTKKL